MLEYGLANSVSHLEKRLTFFKNMLENRFRNALKLI
jgi:hypothetical protein